MSLTLRRGRNGEWRPFWYGEIQVDGVRTVRNLGVKVEGKVPETLRQTGDAKFERSRRKALGELAKAQDATKSKGAAQHLVERLIEEKTGQRVEYVKLSDLGEKWRGVPRERTPGEAWLAWCDTVFARMAVKMPVTYLHEITAEMAGGYLDALRKDYARKTAREAGQLLRSAFARFLPLGMVNPFSGGISRKGEDEDGDMIHRRPFTAQELASLFEAARSDRFLFPLVVTAACTGMRRGDVCQLKWSAVDLDAGVVAVKTSKTGANVEIPIFGPLREVLTAAKAERTVDDVYVFPSAAEMIRHNPDGLTWRFKKLVAVILPDKAKMEEAGQATAPVTLVKLRDELEKVCTAVETCVAEPRRSRMLNTVKLYSSGHSVRDIEKLTGQARSGVSQDLHKAVEVSGVPFMKALGDGGVTARVDRVTRHGEKPDGVTVKKLEGRARRASTFDWHGLRVTWVTLALSAGVPMEVARLVTGHKTVEVVLKHYFKPGREHLRAVLGDKLPDVLTGGGRRSKALECGSSNVGEMSVEELAKRVADRTATAEERKRLMELLGAPGRDWTAVTTSV